MKPLAIQTRRSFDMKTIICILVIILLIALIRTVRKFRKKL
nr:MAG TPA: FeoB-associated Cys-rich membrane protein [Caudoviricetes sp.]